MAGGALADLVKVAPAAPPGRGAVVTARAAVVVSVGPNLAGHGAEWVSRLVDVHVPDAPAVPAPVAAPTYYMLYSRILQKCNYKMSPAPNYPGDPIHRIDT